MFDAFEFLVCFNSQDLKTSRCVQFDYCFGFPGEGLFVFVLDWCHSLKFYTIRDGVKKGMSLTQKMSMKSLILLYLTIMGSGILMGW